MTMRGALCLTFDFDAISLWLARGEKTPGPISRGEFGAHAVPRILGMLARRGIQATFFVPVHTLQTYPEICARIHDAGHEIGLHGDRHESVTSLRPGQEREIALRGMDAISRLTGSAPAGHRTPSFDFSPDTVDILAELDLRYDSSLMGTDTSAYPLRTGDHDRPGEAFHFGSPTEVLELPVSWSLDDHPHFEFYRSSDWVIPGLQQPRAVFEGFLGDVRYLCERDPEGFLVITLHPEVVGRGARLIELERFIDHSADLGARFTRCDELAAAELARMRHHSAESGAVR